jgi:uncharacterized protein
MKDQPDVIQQGGGTVFTKKNLILLLLTLVAVACWVQPALADRLAGAIAAAPQGTDPGQIDPAQPAGFLGIPGAPQISPILAFFWAIWVGWIFSTVGAFGGIMAGVGHMTIYGLGDYARSFRETSPPLNKMVTDSIRGSNQFLVGLSALTASFNYYRMGRLVLPLAIALGLGSILGAWGSVTLSAGRISFSAYQGWFGIFVLVLGLYLFWETSPKGLANKKKAKEAAQAFEATVKRQKAGEKVDTSGMGVKVQKFSFTEARFTFYGVEFKFNPLVPFLGGLAISSVAAFLGVGGGFLLVPFLTSVSQLPMYLAAGTSALAVLISMITSIITLITKGTVFDWGLIGVQLLGIAVGSIIGPRTSKYFSDIWLKRLFIVLALYVGIDFVLKGFFGIRLLG